MHLDELVDRAQRGEHDAFTRIAELMAPRLYNAARYILRDDHTAEDAVQEALIRAWRDFPRLRDGTRFEAWIFRLLNHACHDELRRSKRQLRGSVRPIEPYELVTDDHTSAVASRDEMGRALDRLSPHHRTVLVLYHYAGLTVEGVGQALDVPTGTVKSRLHHATAALRASLEAAARGVPASEAAVRR